MVCIDAFLPNRTWFESPLEWPIFLPFLQWCSGGGMHSKLGILNAASLFLKQASQEEVFDGVDNEWLLLEKTVLYGSQMSASASLRR